MYSFQVKQGEASRAMEEYVRPYSEKKMKKNQPFISSFIVYSPKYGSEDTYYGINGSPYTFLAAKMSDGSYANFFIWRGLQKRRQPAYFKELIKLLCEMEPDNWMDDEYTKAHYHAGKCVWCQVIQQVFIDEDDELCCDECFASNQEVLAAELKAGWSTRP